MVLNARSFTAHRYTSRTLDDVSQGRRRLFTTRVS